MKRVILIVLDSAGAGELPDAAAYGDEGSHTLGHIYDVLKDKDFYKLNELEALGLGHIDGLWGYKKIDGFKGAVGRLKEVSKGKDTTTGHWEIAGIHLNQAFPTYPQGFPAEVVEAFERAAGRKSLGNCVASGTEIIKNLGEEHMKTGFPIVYTSADSVFQIAAHEEVIPIEELYAMCEKARELLTGEHAVGRVIARPFLGSPGSFKRTDRRRDFSLVPPSDTVLDLVKASGKEVRAVGKIEDIFAGRGVTHAIHTHGNMDGVDQTLNWMKEEFEGLLFTNLVDFDMLYGHRNDPEGYGKALKDFDDRLPEIKAAMKDEDILMITADHGCDPTTASTDHSREHVPLVVYGKNVKAGVNLGTRESFADIGASIAQYLEAPGELKGESFLGELLNRQS